MSAPSSKPSPRVTERVIALCIRRAQRDGLAIVFNAKEVPDSGPVRGVCAMGAYERLGVNAPSLRLPSSLPDLARAYDAIEAGFDGNGTACDDNGRPLPRTWIDVGLRLRERFMPMPASDLRRQIEAEDVAVGVSINFTEET